uniref:hypothetical protein n=1 Tax=Fodinicola feengrottensis TaxID=435914 RepID=UPI0013D7654F|nr:hypothetical protein [Fodinicola feengrottensis]
MTVVAFGHLAESVVSSRRSSTFRAPDALHWASIRVLLAVRRTQSPFSISGVAMSGMIRKAAPTPQAPSTTSTTATIAMIHQSFPDFRRGGAGIGMPGGTGPGGATAYPPAEYGLGAADAGMAGCWPVIPVPGCDMPPCGAIPGPALVSGPAWPPGRAQGDGGGPAGTGPPGIGGGIGPGGTGPDGNWPCGGWAPGIGGGGIGGGGIGRPGGGPGAGR